MVINNIRSKIRFYHGILTHDMADQARQRYQTFSLLISALEKYMGEIKGKTILDIGCGRMYPYSLLFHSLGNTVIGIDQSYVGYNEPLYQLLLKELFYNGPMSFFRSVQLKTTQSDRKYYQTLRQIVNFPLNDADLIIKRMNAENMSFFDERFDIAFSADVFEHISNVPKTISEIHRVLVPGGISCNLIHIFTSLSGGHHKYLEKIPPWDHLRNNKFPVPYYLNRMRMHEYISLFQYKFKILQISKIQYPPAKTLLTPDIKKQLENYSEDELLTKNLVIIVRKE